MSSRFKVGVIGLGSMGANHARVYASRDDVDLVALCDADSKVAAYVGHKHRTAHFSDVQVMLERSGVDAVSVAVPTSQHREVARQVIAAGVHVLLEKPIAANVEEGRDIIALARAKGVKLLIGHIERYNPAVRELSARLGQGQLGQMYRIEVDRVGPFPTRIFDVGVILDLAAHDLDIIGSLVGDRPTRLYCQTQQLLHQTHEDVMVGLLNYPGGILAVLNINWTSPVKRRQLRVYGQRGMFSVNYITQDLFLYENPSPQEQEWGGPLGIEEGNMIKFHLARQEPLVKEIDFFLNAIRTDADLSETMTSGLNALRLSQLLVDSAHLEKSIDLTQERWD